MAQKILIAMDDSDNAFRSVELAARTFSTDNTIVLFNVMLDTAALCNMESPELIPLFKAQQTSFCTLEDKKRELVTAAMKRAKDQLIAAGFNEKNIRIKVENKTKGVAHQPSPAKCPNDRPRHCTIPKNSGCPEPFSSSLNKTLYVHAGPEQPAAKVTLMCARKRRPSPA